jgi:hypothetical protein
MEHRTYRVKGVRAWQLCLWENGIGRVKGRALRVVVTPRRAMHGTKMRDFELSYVSTPPCNSPCRLRVRDAHLHGYHHEMSMGTSSCYHLVISFDSNRHIGVLLSIM